MDNQQALANYVPQSAQEPNEFWSAGNTQDEDRPLFSIQQLLVIQKAFWKISALVFIVIVILAVAVSLLTTKAYLGTATLMVHYNPLDPLAAKEFSESAQSSYLPTQIELLQSDAVLDKVIERLSLTSADEFASDIPRDDPARLGWIEAKLRKSLEIEQGHAGSQIIYVNATASTPALAADIANAVVDAYLDIHSTDNTDPSTDRVTRYGEGLDALKRKVETAQKAVTDFRDRAGPIDFDSKGDIELALLDALEHRLLEARSSLRSSQAKISGKRELTTSVLTSSAMAGLREEGNKLAAKMAQLLSEYGPNHPDVQALQSQIDANKAAQAATHSAYSAANSSDIVVANSEVESLERAVAAQRAKLRQVKHYRDRAAKYQLELDSAQQVYKKALDGFDQEKFAAGGRKQHLTIASRARPPVKPYKPNRVKYMLAGVVAGLMLALLTPFVMELPRRKIRCRDDLERDMRIPILIELPNIPSPSLQAGGRA
jgi:succinoglycan biosynthesis transport protein ExoP